MANFYRLIAFLCFLYPSLCFSQAAPVGTVDLAGWIKEIDGTYSRAYTNADGTSSKISLTSAPKGITTTSTALVQTSKGITAFDIAKTAQVTTSRVGAGVVGLMKSVGPLGMTIGAVSLVCELTSICNDAGAWALKQINFGDSESSGYYGTCQEAIGLAAGANWTDCTNKNAAFPGAVWFRSPKTPPAEANCINRGGTAWTYTANAYTCGNLPATYTPATDAQLDEKASLLNDDRLIPELIEKGRSVPTDGVPTLTPDQKKNLGVDSSPTTDSSGNVTGRQETTTSIEAVDSGTADKPGSVIIKETKATVKYDNSNNQISTSTSTSYTNQPESTQPSGFTISFDTVPEATLPTYNVPNSFSSTTWGSGSCPSNIDVTLSAFAFVIPTQPICDTAEMINPFVLLLSSLIAIYIIAGVRGGAAA